MKAPRYIDTVNSLVAFTILTSKVNASLNTGCVEACTDLASNYPQQTLFKNTPAYQNFTDAYWAKQQQETEPSCVFKPKIAADVSYFLRLSQRTGCAFAVKSGGHGAFVGVSSIQSGITVSMDYLNEITVSPDNATVTIGTGNNWRTVYQALESHDLAVAGGRYPTVGVGGLSLGGGISFFAPAQGWTCDNIIRYELVLADGEVIQVDNASFPDLHWALRGGGNNFGIVTKITMGSFPLPQGLLWGGLKIFEESQIPALLDAAYSLGTTGVAEDRAVGQILNIGRIRGAKIAIAILSYSEPVDNPAVMGEYLSIPAITGSTNVRTLANLSAELAENDTTAPRLRSRGTVTFNLEPDMMTYAKSVCFEEFDNIADISDLDSMCIFQVVTAAQLEESAKKGGNAFGLAREEGPLLLLNVLQSWPDDVDESRVKLATKNIVKRTSDYAEIRGWSLDYRYMNYAGEFQDVISGYGADSRERLIAVAKRYDPDGVFQVLQPGYFKLTSTSVI